MPDMHPFIILAIAALLAMAAGSAWLAWQAFTGNLPMEEV